MQSAQGRNKQDEINRACWTDNRTADLKKIYFLKHRTVFKKKYILKSAKVHKVRAPAENCKG